VKDFLEGTYFVGVHGSLEIVVIIRVLLSLGNVSIAWYFSYVIYSSGKTELNLMSRCET